ncbi:unnamed protein product, partial [Staurois parvus]
MCRVSPHDMPYQEKSEGDLKKGRNREVRIKENLYTMQRINPLGSTVSITSMLYCQGRTDNSWGPRAIGDHGGPCVIAQTQKSL